MTVSLTFLDGAVGDLNGGSITAGNADVSIYNCIFQNNTSQQNGGAIHASMSHLKINNSKNQPCSFSILSGLNWNCE